MGKKKLLQSYNVFLREPWKELSVLLQENEYSKIFILTDDNTHQWCLPVLQTKCLECLSAHVIKVYAGEQYKNLAAVEYVWKELSQEQADRRSVLICLGGGIIGDLGGFAASCYKRGIDCIQVPTTLLGMVDAAYGGKTGIDFLNLKNQIGVFRMPEATVVDSLFLETLSEEQLRNGFAEVIKHALLNEKKEWKKISEAENWKSHDWPKVIERSAAFKLFVVNDDPDEELERMVLNFGHTIGHAIESLLLEQQRQPLHGYCVAAGMVGDIFLSNKMSDLPDDQMNEVVAYLIKIFPPVINELMTTDALIEKIMHDKKNHHLKIVTTQLKSIGSPVIVFDTDADIMRSAIEFIRTSYQK